VRNFLNESWNPIHVTVGLFEVNELNGQSMAIQLESLFLKFGLMQCDCIYERRGQQFDNRDICIIIHC